MCVLCLLVEGFLWSLARHDGWNMYARVVNTRGKKGHGAIRPLPRNFCFAEDEVVRTLPIDRGYVSLSR